MSGAAQHPPGQPPAGCPDDNAIAELVGGVASPEVAAALESHVDGCERCRALMTELGRLLGPEAEAPGALVQGAPEPRAMPGASLGRYHVKEQLGVGAMGVVYLADDPVLGREVAIKLMRPDLFLAPGGDALLRRFHREARLLAQLSHPNVVTVYDAGEADQGVYIAMEYVPGQTLGQWLAAASPAGWEVVDVMVQAGRGLEAAHRAGLVHRDVKPDNILVGIDGRARIGDFGLAFQATDGGGSGADATHGSRSRGSRLTATGAVVGTPAYMAPEQLAGLGADDRSDQYAFCATLFEVLLGRPVSARQEWITSALAGRVQTAVPAGSLPAAVQAVLRRGLRDDPDQRFSGMQTLLLDLADGTVAARWAPKRSGRWALVGGGVAAALLAAVLLLIQVLPAEDATDAGRETTSSTTSRVVVDDTPPPPPRTRPMGSLPGPRAAPRQAAPGGAALPALLDFRSGAGGYRIWLPAKPTKQVLNVPTPAGTVAFHAQMVNLKGHGCGHHLGCTFIVGWGDYPAKFMKHSMPETLLNRSRDGAIRNINGKLVREVRINLDGWPGRIVMVSKAAPPRVPVKQLTLQMRMFMVRNRFYQLQALCAAPHAAAPIINRVLDSFRLWKPRGPPATK